jgi:hypothetical protein
MVQKHRHHHPHPVQGRRKIERGRLRMLLIGSAIVLCAGAWWLFTGRHDSPASMPVQQHRRVTTPVPDDSTEWIRRALAISRTYHNVYTPCWEGAYGAIGDASLFAVTKDSSLLQFHLSGHDLRNMCVGTWVDDRAWVALAEFAWWDVTGRRNERLVADARKRYLEARSEGRLSHAEGFWSWYNYPPGMPGSQRIFTNSNMNQMAAVAARLYEATHEKEFLKDALLVWKGDGKIPGVLQTLYKGEGRWKGKEGLAAFGKQLPWEGAEYCSIGAALYRVTGDTLIRRIIIETARRIMDPANGWVDAEDFYQIRMDGNGAFVNYLMDAWTVAPRELSDIPVKVGRMLNHVWTNHYGASTVTLRRTTDNAIRNGWNPSGGEDGYGVDEIGTVHAQAEAARAFGIYANAFTRLKRK